MALTLTNTSAALALQNLNAASSDVAASERRVATGLKVGTAKDDGATWAIAQNLRNQISGWGAVSQNLDRAQSILDVAASSTGQISDLLDQLKEKAVSFSDTSLDTTSRSAIRSDMTALVKQIDNTANSADFNGVNLLNTPGASGAEVTSFEQAGPILTYHATGQTVGLGAWCPLTASLTSVFYMSDDGSVMTNIVAPPMYPAPAGDQHEDWTLNSALGPGTFSFTFNANPGDYFGFDVQEAARPPVKIVSDPNGGTTTLNQTNLTSSGLSLSSLNFSDPSQIISTVDAAIDTTNSEAEKFGAQQNALAVNQKQVSSTTDALTTGVGNLVDANMATEATQLQAKQTKLQLATQSLSIANSAPQILLSLFK